MSHLEDLAAALVDDELSAEQRDRALAHVAGCGTCREEVDAQRRLKARLARLPEPQVSADLAGRLAAVPDREPVERRRRRRTVAPVGPAGGRPRKITRRSRRPAGARSPVRMAAGALSAIAFALTGAVMLGGSQGDVKPPVSSFVVDHTASTVGTSLDDPAADIVLASFPR